METTMLNTMDDVVKAVYLVLPKWGHRGRCSIACDARPLRLDVKGIKPVSGCGILVRPNAVSLK